MTVIIHIDEKTEIHAGDTINFHGVNMDAITRSEQVNEVHFVLTAFEQDNRLKGRTADGEVYDLEKDLLYAYDVTSVAVKKGAKA